MASNNGASGGVGLCGLVFVVFLTLKLCEKINWSWWWVTAPLWMPLAVGLTIAGLLMVVGVTLLGVAKLMK